MRGASTTHSGTSGSGVKIGTVSIRTKMILIPKKKSPIIHEFYVGVTALPLRWAAALPLVLRIRPWVGSGSTASELHIAPNKHTDKSLVYLLIR
jgi:hypothetical protein